MCVAIYSRVFLRPLFILFLVLLCPLLTVAGWGAGSAEFLIVPGASIGNIRLGMHISEVNKLLGTPDNALVGEASRVLGAPDHPMVVTTGRATTYQWKGGFAVKTDGREKVFEVSVSLDERYATFRGLHTYSRSSHSDGSSRADVVSAMGNPSRVVSWPSIPVLMLVYDEGILFWIWTKVDQVSGITIFYPGFAPYGQVSHGCAPRAVAMSTTRVGVC